MYASGVRYIDYPSKASEIHLYWTADWHIGNRGAAMDKLKRDLKQIEEDEMGFWLGGGDYSDCISADDRRWDPEVVSPDIKVAELARIGNALGERVRDLMKPIAPKCLGLLYGNHEDKYMQSKNARQLHSWLCQELAVPDLGYSTVFDIRFRYVPRLKQPCRLTTWVPWCGKPLPKAPKNRGTTWSRRVFAHHGAGYAQTPGGKLNKLRQAMDYFPKAQLTFLAHVHEQKAEPSTVLDGDEHCTKIVHDTRRGVIAGTYLRTYVGGPAGYGEKKLYRPVPLGSVEVVFWPGKQEFKVLI